MGVMKRIRTGLFAAPVALAVALAPSVCRAEVPVCVEVVATPQELPGLQKLVKSELDRHPSHRVVPSGCSARLRVELFEAAGARYLTAQIDQEVPARYVVHEPSELGARLTDALSLALHNDPTYLSEDIAHYDAMQRFAHSVLKNGVFKLRVELFEAVSNGGSAPAFGSGAAVAVTRGSGHWQVLARMYGGGALPPNRGRAPVLEVMAGADAGLTYELWERDLWSPYVSGCAGVSFVRYAARDQGGAFAAAQHVGAALSLRGGVRLLRASRFDLDLFAQAYLPLFLTSDDDGSLFTKPIYTPTVQLGIGVGF